MNVKSSIIRKVFNKGKKLGFHASKEEIETYQFKKLRKVINSAYKTPYWNNEFKELGITPNDIKSLDDFINKVPKTDRYIVEKHGDELLIPGTKDKLIEMHTSGSTTGKQLTFYHNKIGTGITTLVTIDRMFKVVGVKPTDNIVFLFPKESSIWNVEKIVTMYFPNLKFLDPRDLEADIKKLSSVNAVYSYTHLPYAIFKKVGNDDLIKNVTKDMKAFGLSGDVITEHEKEYLTKTTGAEVITPLTSIDCPFPTIFCQHGSHHLVPDSYFSEIDDKDGLILTNLSKKQGTYALRYVLGDRVKKIDCDCGWTWDSITIKGRIYEGELHKHLSKQDISEVISKLDSLEKKLIIYDIGAEKIGNKVDIYVKKGPNYISECHSGVINEIKENLSKQYAIKILMDTSTWEFNINLVDEIPEHLRSEYGKHKVILK